MQPLSRPKPSIRLNSPLKQPDGRPLLDAPSIGMDDLLDRRTPPVPKNEKPARIPFLYRKLPQLDVPPRNDNGETLYPPSSLENTSVFEHRLIFEREKTTEEWKDLPALSEWNLPDLKKSPIAAATEPVSEPMNEPIEAVQETTLNAVYPMPQEETNGEDTQTEMQADILPLPPIPEYRFAALDACRSASSAPVLLCAEGLTKSYYKKKLRIPVLKDVNFSVQQGEFVSIVGQSGSGKSTLLHLLGTLDSPEYGSISFEGRRIDNLSAAKRDNLRNRDIGFIFQFYHLLPELTTLENVLSPLMIRCGFLNYFRFRRGYIERAKDLLDKVGLSHRLKHKPNELSGGEMQRAAIARALIAEPKMLLADEPTGNLDSVSAKEIIRLLQTFNREHNVTMVMVTHDNSIAQIADRIVRIADGVIANNPYA